MASLTDYIVAVPERQISRHQDKRLQRTSIEYLLDTSYGHDKKDPQAREGVKKQKRVCIGYLVEGSDGKKMHPTEAYKELFVSSWQKVSQEKINTEGFKIGLYGAMQAIDQKAGLLKRLEECFGERESLALIDLALCLLPQTEQDQTRSITEEVEYQLLFSAEKSASSYLSLLETIKKEQIEQFAKQWMLSSSKKEQEVWILLEKVELDSDDDKASLSSHLSPAWKQEDLLSKENKGQREQEKNSFLLAWAFLANGLPLCYAVQSNLSENLECIQKLIASIKEQGLKAAGLWLDLSCCPENENMDQLLDYLKQEKLDCLMPCNQSMKPYRELLRKTRSSLQPSLQNYLPNSRDLFAIQKQAAFFPILSDMQTCTLFYDVTKAAKELKELLGPFSKKEGHRQKEGPNQEENIEKLSQSERDILQEKIDTCGVVGILSSLALDPIEIHHLYQACSCFQKQLQIWKKVTDRDESLQAFLDKVSDKSSDILDAWLFVLFLSCILRWYIACAAQKIELNSGLYVNISDPLIDELIEEINRLGAVRIHDVYGYRHNATDKVEEFFAFFGVDGDELLEKAVKMENGRLVGRTRKKRKRKPGPKKGSHHKKYDEQGNVIRKKPGVAKGTKRGPLNKDGTPRKKPGVPVGTKREAFKKDGSPRKKPGPKPKTNIEQT